MPTHFRTVEICVDVYHLHNHFLENSKTQKCLLENLILNSNIGWKNNKNNFDLNLTYNYSSKRLVYIGAGEAPDEYEYPKPDLNFTTKYKISGIEFSFKIKNLLNSSIRLGSEYNNCGDDGLCKDDEGYTGPDQGEKYNIRYFTRSYKPGTSYSFTISYNL